MERITYSFIPNPYISIMTGCKYMRVPLVPLHLGCTSYINKQRKTTINNNKKKGENTKKKKSQAVLFNTDCILLAKTSFVSLNGLPGGVLTWLCNFYF